MKKPIAAILLLLTLAACSSFIQPTPTAVPTPTFTVIPTFTATVPPTNTELPPTKTPDVLSELISQGQPASEWNGIPIMPNAVAGEGDKESYAFTVKAMPHQIKEYYQVELGKLGWRSFVQGNGDSSLILMFMNNASETLTLSLIVMGNQSLVLLVK